MATLHGLVSRKGGDAVVFFDGSNETRMTYDQLHEISDQIASTLPKSSRDSVVVGIHMEMSAVVPACILGILKASCCFVYLSPTESTAYLNRMIDRARVQYLIVDPAKKIGFSIKASLAMIDGQVKIVQLNSTHTDVMAENGSRDVLAQSYAQSAYIMFTSGTTGDSKMVRVPHCCIAPNILHLWKEYDAIASDVIFLSSPLTFDPSIVDIFLVLSCGATLLIVADVVKTQPKTLAKAFQRFGVTILQTTPTLLLRFPNAILKRLLSSTPDSDHSLRILTLGGEPFPASALAPYLCGGGDDQLLNRRLRIYNIYGPTEVSCWSTLHRVTKRNIEQSAVPIGRPMLGTMIKLMNGNGTSINGENEIGELRIGGHTRRCFVDQESPYPYDGSNRPYLRPTGDLAYRLEDGNYYLVGRRDDQTKRMGKRLNLIQIAEIIEKRVEVKQCVVVLDRSNSLRAFIQLHVSAQSTSDEQSRINSVIAKLRISLEESLPSYCQPDFYHVVKSLPITKHGKVDRRMLMLAVTELDHPSLPRFSMDAVDVGIEKILRMFIPDRPISINANSTIRQWGIDSLKAVVLSSMLERWSNLTLPRTLEILTSGTILALVQYVRSMATGQRNSTEIQNGKRLSVNDLFTIPTKRTRLDNTSRELHVVEKCGRIRLVGNSNGIGTESIVKWRDTKFAKKWYWDSGKCIDASPVLVKDLTNSQQRVYIGSHSGKFVCLDARTGDTIWVQQLDGRIEASATVTACGKYIVVSCYDGCVYFFDQLGGKRWWIFKTMDVIKCTACTGDQDCVYIGSHDHRLYKLNFQAKQCIWQADLGGAIFSTPVYKTDVELVFVATLTGNVICLQEDGNVVWSINLQRPVFASLMMTNDCVLAACVDGRFHWINWREGQVVRQFEANGHIFATPAIVQVSTTSQSSNDLVFGCGNLVYYLRDGEAIWIRQLPTDITSSPFVFQAYIRGELKALCCVVTKSGTLQLLSLDDGNSVCGNYELGSEVFSSPIVDHNRIFVGCRDNAIYCLEIETD